MKLTLAVMRLALALIGSAYITVVGIFLILGAIPRRVNVQAAPIKPAPWTVICDNQGHYAFVDEDAKLWAGNEWSTYDEAMEWLLRVKRGREERVITEDDRRKFNRIRGRKWEACPP